MGLSSFFAKCALCGGLAALVVACDALPDIDKNVCGNKLVEAAGREVCDGFAKAASAGDLPTLCAEPGERFQCQYIHDAEHDCPVGYGAGLDGLCREALGLFSDAPAHIDATGTSILVADFDGDARNDLLTWSPLSAEAKVTYLEPGLQPGTTSLVAMSRAVRPPSTGLLGSDEVTDIALADPIGVLVFRGRSDRAFEPKAYATIPVPPNAIPIAIPLAALVPLDESGAFQGAHFVGQLAEIGPDLVIVYGSQTLALIPDAALGDVVGVTLVDIDASPPFDEGSEEVVIALYGDNDRVVAVTPHLDGDLQKQRTLDSFGFGRRLLSGPFKVDNRIGVGIGDDDARSVMLLSPGLGTQLSAAEALVGDVGGDAIMPIAMGSYDVFGLKFPFVVLPYQVLLQTDFADCTVDDCFTVVATNPGLYPWSAAAFDEKNGVVLAGSYATTGLDVFRYNPGSTALNASRVSTDAPVLAVYPGNFDGDAASDFLIRTRFSEPGCDDDSKLAVSWGSASGFPSQPVSLGEVPGLNWVAPGAFAVPPSIDSISDFVVQTTCDESRNAGLFLGTATRQLESPFQLGLDLPELDDVAGDVSNAGATALVLLDLGAPGGGPPDGVDDLLALAIDGDSISMFPFFAGPDAELESGAPGFPVTTVADPPTMGAAIGSASVSAVDMDDDGDDDVLLVMSIPEDADVAEPVFRPHVFVGIVEGGSIAFSERAAADGSLVWITRGEADKPVTAGSAFYAAALLTTDIAYADADGDGVRDLVVRVVTPDLVGILAAESYLFSFRGAQDGTFSEQSFELPEGSLVRGLAGAEGRVPGAALAIATADDVLLCGAAAGEAGCASAGIAPADSAIIGVAMADLDNDGVPDLAIARGDGIEIHRQLTAQDEVANGE